MSTAPSPAPMTDAQRLIAEIHHRRHERRRRIALALAVVILPSIYPAWVAIRHVIATTYLESRSFFVSWDLNRDNWTRGGVTSVEVAPLLFGFGGDQHGSGYLSYITRLHRVERLDLTRLDDFDDEALALLSELTDLVALNLDQGRPPTWLGRRQGKPTDATLARIGKLVRLRELNLAGHEVTDVGIKHLANLAELESLDLKDTGITDAGLEILKGLANLKYVNLHGTKVTPAGCRGLKLARPNADVDADFDPFAPGPR